MFDARDRAWAARLDSVIQAAVKLAFVLATPQQSADVALREFQETNHVVGLVACVYANGKQVYFGSAGFADRERQIRPTDKTWFRLGSISKPVTAVGAMKMVEQSKFDIDADCKTWLPEWPMDRPRTTIRNFLNHTSGVRHYNGRTDPDGTRHYESAREASRMFVNDDLLFVPGTKFSYSTHAYTLVARAMEKANNESFADFMRREIFPYGGGGLDVELLTDRKNRSALYALVNGRGMLDEPREDNSWKFAGGGMEATAPGLARFFSELAYWRIVGGQSLRTMWSSAKLNDGSFNNYGLGFGLKGRIVSHNGAQQGCRTAMVMDVSKRTIAVVLCNTEGNYNPGTLADRLLEMADRMRP